MAENVIVGQKKRWQDNILCDTIKPREAFPNKWKGDIENEEDQKKYVDLVSYIDMFIFYYVWL